MTVKQRLFERFRHPQLLACLGLLLVAGPFLRGEAIGEISSNLLLLVTCLSAIVAFAANRVHLVVGLLLTVAAQASIVYRDFLGETDLFPGAGALLGLLFFTYFCALVLGDVFRAKDVSYDTIAGALSAYLLLGVCWAYAYALLESVEPGSIDGLGDAEGVSIGNYLSYSFVTLTTLGYGNVVPVSYKAEALAYVEAIVGQFYLTVLVARLVAMSITSGQAGAGPDGDA